MRQLITRIDDDLHARIKARAEREGSSVNTFVTRVLRQAVSAGDARADLQRRLRESGRLVTLPVSGPVPTRDEVIAELRGSADVVLEAIDAGRSPR